MLVQLGNSLFVKSDSDSDSDSDSENDYHTVFVFTDTEAPIAEAIVSRDGRLSDLRLIEYVTLEPCGLVIRGYRNADWHEHESISFMRKLLNAFHAYHTAAFGVME